MDFYFVVHLFLPLFLVSLIIIIFFLFTCSK